MSKPAEKHVKHRISVKQSRTADTISALDKETESLAKFEFSRPAARVGALLVEQRKPSRLLEYLADPVIVACIVRDFPE